MMKLQLEVLLGKQSGQFLNFSEGEFVFGRGPECHVRPNCELVSRQHCLISVTDKSVAIRDLGSANGTLVNGGRVRGAQNLSDGDHIQLGPLAFLVIIPLENRAAETVADSSIFEASKTMDDTTVIRPEDSPRILPVAETVSR
jgi:pSer/pThr/pTyr-binding forkhead associated (FHA) protein